MYFVHCDDLETYRQVIRNEIKDWVTNFTGTNAKRTADQDWCIVVINTDAHPGAAGDGAGTGGSGGSGGAGGAASQGMAKLASQTQKFLSMKTSVLDKIKSDFGGTAPLSVPSSSTQSNGANANPSSSSSAASSGNAAPLPPRRLDRIISLRLHAGDFTKSHEGWSDFFTRIKDGLLTSFETQVARYDDDIQRLDAQRMIPGWNYCQFFLLKEGLANCFAATNLVDDALVQLDELEAAWEQTVHRQVVGFSEFISASPSTDAADGDHNNEGGEDHVGPMMLLGVPPKKDYRSLLISNSISIFDFRVYLAARQFAQLVRQRRPVDLASRVLRWLRAFVPVVHENHVQEWFAESLILSVVEATLAAMDAMIPLLKLDSEQMARVQGAKLDVALVGKSALDRVGAKVHGLKPSLGTSHSSPPSPSATAANQSTRLALKLSTPTLVSSLSSLNAFAQVYTWYLDQGDLCSQLAHRPRFAMMLQTDRANLAYAQGDWALAGDLYAKVVTSYAEAGWLAVDRCLLQRQAQCYRAVGARQEYLMTCLRLVASNIVHSGGGSGRGGPPATAAVGEDMIDWTQLTGVARELEDPVVVEFAPLFQVRLPPNLFTVVDSASPPRISLDPDAMVIVSHLASPLAIDRVSLTLVGGETNDLVFSTRNVDLVPGPQGTRLEGMHWDAPGTAGDYVAEKVKIEVGKLVFVTNLLKENRKHTLRILEPPAPVSLDVGLPLVLADGNRDVMVRIVADAAAEVLPNGILTLWSLHPQPKALVPERVELVDPVSGEAVVMLHRVSTGADADAGGMVVEHPGRFLVPGIKADGAAVIRLTLPEPWMQVAIKAVFEATLPHSPADAETSGVPLTVSLVESVVNVSVPLVDAEVQVMGGSHEYLVLTLTNANATGVLSVDACEVQVDSTVAGGEVIPLNPETVLLPAGRTASLAYLIQGMASVDVLRGSICIRHHFFDEDVRHFMFSTLRRILAESNLLLYYPLLKQAWASHIAALDSTKLTLTGTMAVPDPGPLSLGILPPPVLDSLQAAATDFYAKIKSVKLSQVQQEPQTLNHRMTRIPIALELPVARLQYGLSPLISPSDSRRKPLVTVGTPLLCQVVIKRLPTRRRATSKSHDTMLEFVYEIVSAEDTWLVVGGRRRVFSLAPEAEITYPVSLIPLVSGQVAVPLVQLGVRPAPGGQVSDEAPSSAPMVSVEPLVGQAYPRAVQVCPEPTTTLVVVDGTQVQRVGQPRSAAPGQGTGGVTSFTGSAGVLNQQLPPTGLPPPLGGDSYMSLMTSSVYSVAAGVGAGSGLPARTGSRSSLSGPGGSGAAAAAAAAVAGGGSNVSRSVLGLHRNSDFSLSSSTGTPA
ncbi:hypothetical protein BCR44DRAFT_1178879 [Catenaria anguillulae PL171]|uniref:Trafficking protein particle complex subunit 10 n=1 Tax=Catenaria anguillulae PL171 TaxID=765915 RepID=A0A1Y2HK89_9FUNG|nr:hypothetical protein BCR44DRAFT_1178879 [Catenaria anguillulae PL171]